MLTSSHTWLLHHYPANWSIVNLRPAPPLRATLSSNNSSTNGGTLSSASRKPQPTYEEDALVLRVIEAYCAAYQNPSRNTMHSGEFHTYKVYVCFCFYVSFFYTVNTAILSERNCCSYTHIQTHTHTHTS